MAAAAAAITKTAPKKLAVYGLGQFGFAMTELFSAKHPSVPVEAYDPVTVRTLPYSFLPLPCSRFLHDPLPELRMLRP